MKSKSITFTAIQKPELGSDFDPSYPNFVRDLAKVMELTTGSTYPTKTLVRRLGLLSQKELKNCQSYWGKLCSYAEKIDETIADVAERKNDPWS